MIAITFRQYHWYPYVDIPADGFSPAQMFTSARFETVSEALAWLANGQGFRSLRVIANSQYLPSSGRSIIEFRQVGTWNDEAALKCPVLSWRTVNSLLGIDLDFGG